METYNHKMLYEGKICKSLNIINGVNPKNYFKK